MKPGLRIFLGLVGLIAILFGVRQMMTRGGGLSAKAPVDQVQKVGEIFTATDGAWSYRIPQGWENKPGQQPGFTMFVAPKESGYVANMVTAVESFDGALRAYADANIKAVQAAFPDSKVLSDAEFSTDAKAVSYKLKFQNKVKDSELMQTMYFFEGQPGRKIAVTCTAPLKQGPELDPLFDECMKSFVAPQK